MTLNFGQQLFPPRREIIASFDFVDVATQTGYITYYWSHANTTDNFFTTDNTYNSMLTDTKVVSNLDIGDASELATTEDIDLTFNVATNLRGLMQFDLALGAESGSSATLQCFLKMQAYHYDGSTETSISTQVTTENMHLQDGSTQGRQRYTGQMNISSQQHFKAGETLRIKVEVWLEDEGSVGRAYDVWFGHDPANRATNSDRIQGGDDSNFVAGETRSTLNVPYKIPI